MNILMGGYNDRGLIEGNPIARKQNIELNCRKERVRQTYSTWVS